eukprot:CAMPEP_0169097994 /NCGR_PEP_ID=MMETSP1015-20121227/19805_1 /TAXON_ID=342587 /ORGANISM="Karlodinium micrum, Strain CCMP2283" /LENGTH=1137 /DNA_ID=CAMNT_0009158815 /DNA_START=33 /DNA_END=3446 /DNA_ORIENTATION=-
MHFAPTSGIPVAAGTPVGCSFPSERAVVREAMVATLEDMITTLEDTLSVLPASKCTVPPPPPYPPPVVNRRGGTCSAPVVVPAGVDVKSCATTRASSPCLSHASPTPNIAWSGATTVVPIASIPTPLRSRTLANATPSCSQQWSQASVPKLASVVQVGACEAREAARQETVFRKSRSTPSLGRAVAATHVRYASPQARINGHRSAWTGVNRSPSRFARRALSPGPSRRGGSTRRHITVQVVADAAPPQRSNSFVRIASSRHALEDLSRQSLPLGMHIHQVLAPSSTTSPQFQTFPHGPQLTGSVLVPHTASAPRLPTLPISGVPLGSATCSARSWAPTSFAKRSERSRHPSPRSSTPSCPPSRRPPQLGSARAYAYRQPAFCADQDVHHHPNPSPTASQYQEDAVTGSFQSDGDAGAGIGNASIMDDNIEQPQMLLRAIRWVFAAFGLPPPPLDPPTLRVLVRDFEMQQLEIGANWQASPTCCAHCARHVCAVLFELASGERTLVPVADGKSVPVSTQSLGEDHIQEDWFLAYASCLEEIHELLAAWDSEQQQRRIRWLLRRVAPGNTNQLQWQGGDVSQFAKQLFTLLKLPSLQCPSAVLYQLVRDCETGIGAELDEIKAAQFGRYMLETVVQLNTPMSPTSDREPDVLQKEDDPKDEPVTQRERDIQTMGYARSLFDFMVSLHPSPATSDPLDQSSVTLPPPNGTGTLVASPDVAGGGGMNTRTSSLTADTTSEALEKACGNAAQQPSQDDPNGDRPDFMQLIDGNYQRIVDTSIKASSNKASPKSSRMMHCASLKEHSPSMLPVETPLPSEAVPIVVPVDEKQTDADTISRDTVTQPDVITNEPAIDGIEITAECVVQNPTEELQEVPIDGALPMDAACDQSGGVAVTVATVETEASRKALLEGATSETEARMKALLEGATLRCGVARRSVSAASDEDVGRGSAKLPNGASPSSGVKSTIEGVRRSLTPTANTQTPEVAPKASYQVMSSELFRALARRRSKNGESWSPLKNEVCTIEVPKVDVPSVPSPCRNRASSVLPLDCSTIQSASGNIETPKGTQVTPQVETPQQRTQQRWQMLVQEEQTIQDVLSLSANCSTQFFDIGTPAEGTSPPTQPSHELEDVWNSEGASKLAAA